MWVCIRHRSVVHFIVCTKCKAAAVYLKCDSASYCSVLVLLVLFLSVSFSCFLSLSTYWLSFSPSVLFCSLFWPAHLFFHSIFPLNIISRFSTGIVWLEKNAKLDSSVSHISLLWTWLISAVFWLLILPGLLFPVEFLTMLGMVITHFYSFPFSFNHLLGDPSYLLVVWLVLCVTSCESVCS